MPTSHTPLPRQQCTESSCPYAGDFGVIKTKLDAIDKKIDEIAVLGGTTNDRLRFLENSQARVNGMESQRKWDVKTIVMMAMFILSFLGVLLTVVRDFNT
jgi:hypothetical protein